jgi:hypothetical protein
MVPDVRFPAVIRTSRGLTVGGRRLTLYLIEDHLRSGIPSDQVREVFGLSEHEMADVMGYIAAHSDEFEREYQHVLRVAGENRRYWDERNRRRFEEIKQAPKSPQQESVCRRIEQIKQRLAQT